MLKQAYTKTLTTPVGDMLAVADDHFLYFLEFSDTPGFEKQINSWKKQQGFSCEPGNSDPIISIERELAAYFQGKLQHFKTPIRFFGTDFQQIVWKALDTIPFGQTISYTELAEKTGKPTACRAAANANAVNRFAIIIPCHRVIRLGGALGGYAGGVDRKRWLLQHEMALIKK